MINIEIQIIFIIICGGYKYGSLQGRDMWHKYF